MIATSKNQFSLEKFIMDVAKKSRTDLKAYFVKNAIPTESNFADLIDAMLNQKEDGLAKPAGNPLSIEATGDASSLRKAINFYESFADANPAWSISLNPRINAERRHHREAGVCH